MAFRFEELEIWRKAIDFANNVYFITRSFPREELYSLTDQLKRASSSISANIAEGSGSSSKKDFPHYLDIAIKSTYEVTSHLFLAEKLGYLSEEIRLKLYDEADMLSRKIRAFKRSIS